MQKSYSSPSEIYADKSSLYKWCRVWVGCGSFWRICTSRGGVFQKHRVWSIRYNGMGNLLALFKYTACWVVSDKVIGGLTLLRLDNAFQPSQLELKFNLCLITTGMFFMCSWCMKCIKSAICSWRVSQDSVVELINVSSIWTLWRSFSLEGVAGLWKWSIGRGGQGECWCDDVLHRWHSMWCLFHHSQVQSSFRKEHSLFQRRIISETWGACTGYYNVLHLQPVVLSTLFQSYGYHFRHSLTPISSYYTHVNSSLPWLPLVF